MTIRAALLDERGVYQGMDVLEDASALTERHLPQIVSCDLAPGRYVWIPDEKRGANGLLVNPYGGAFWEIAWLKRVAATRAQAAAIRERNGSVDPPEKAGVDTGALVEFLETRGLA
jgi:hypothetical protein